MINKNIINQNAQYINPSVKVKKEFSALKLNQTHQTSGELGKLLPIYQRELIPGEKISLNQDIAIQTQPLVANLMHEIRGEVMYYFVPNRLVHPQWEEFITGGKDGATTVKNIFVNPDIAKRTDGSDVYYNFADELKGTLWDYFGYPMPNGRIPDTAANQNMLKSIMPNSYRHRGYNKIWNDSLRYPDIDEEVDLDNNEVLTGYWPSDYYTRSRIYQQRGIAPMIPISGNFRSETQYGSIEVDGTNYELITTDNQGSIALNGTGGVNPPSANRSGVIEIPSYDISADGGSMSLNDFLTGLAILRYQVNNARLQPRYIDQLRARFGVYPEDSRLQRPEYLGSGEFTIGISTTTNTSEDQGNITGQGWASNTGMSAEYEAKEHGWIHAILIVRPSSVYEGTMSKMDRRETRYDYPTPELYNVPDVPVLNENIAWGVFDPNDDTAEKKKTRMKKIFGYQDVYEENRTNVNIVSGLMRPSINQNLAVFNLARYFTSPPNLNGTFLRCNPPVDRVKTYQEQPFMQSIFVRTQINTAIPLPIQSAPATVTTI